jgi:hypothetical protein
MRLHSSTEILTEDLQAPVKQCHTARRIRQRLCAELPGITGSERTVCCYAHRQKRLLGLGDSKSLCRRATTGVLKRR